MNNYIFDRNKPFNNLPLLPPAKELENDNDILKKLVSASRALSSVNVEMARLPNPFILINTISIQEAKSSSEIENIFTTEDELFKAISDSNREELTDPATREVLRYREALWTGYNSIAEKKEIGLQTIINIVQQVKGTNIGIRPPQAMVIIRRGNSELHPGEVVYTPPRGEGIIESYLKNMIEYMNDSSYAKTDPLLKMCIAHYQFEAIHPFQDGNGRITRALTDMLLAQSDKSNQRFYSMSAQIRIERKEYYEILEKSQKGNLDITEWMIWFLNCLINALKSTDSQLVSVLFKADFWTKNASTLINERQKKLLNNLLDGFDGKLTSAKWAKITKSSKDTAIRDINDLIDKGILQKEAAGGRSTSYELKNN